jgi:hypothetical protein
MPVNLQRYGAYLRRQGGLILAKCGDGSAIREASEGIRLAQDISCSDKTEAIVRQLEVATLLGLYALGKAAEVNLSKEPEQKEDIRKVIRYRAVAGWLTSQECYEDARKVAESALHIAAEKNFLHQYAKISELLNAIKDHTYFREHWILGKKGEVPRQPSEFLCSII